MLSGSGINDERELTVIVWGSHAGVWLISSVETLLCFGTNQRIARVNKR